MKHLKFLQVSAFLLFAVFTVLLFPTDTFAYSGKATSDVHNRWSRLPGEPAMYDPHTGVEFNPMTGEILNLSDFKRLPGEVNYQKTSGSYKYFDPKIYYQYVVDESDVSEYKEPTFEDTSAGWTIYWGISVEGGIGAWGATSSGDLAFSYNEDKNQIVISVVGGAGAKTATFGEDASVGTHFGFSLNNETELDGLSVGSSVSLPIGEITVKRDEDWMGYDTFEFELQAGTSYAFSGYDTTWDTRWEVARWDLW